MEGFYAMFFCPVQGMGSGFIGKYQHYIPPQVITEVKINKRLKV